MFSLKRSKTLNIDQFVKNLGAKVSNAMIETGKVLLDNSLELVPRDTGTLADSAVCRHEGEGFNTEVVVGYGRFDLYVGGVYSPNENRIVNRKPSEYAAPVHENMQAQHPVGEADYLRGPAQDIEFLAFVLRVHLHG